MIGEPPVLLKGGGLVAGKPYIQRSRSFLGQLRDDGDGKAGLVESGGWKVAFSRRGMEGRMFENEGDLFAGMAMKHGEGVSQ